MLKRLIFRGYARTGAAQAVWAASARRLRILAYHGVCEDRYANDDWVPPYFVTASLFESHLQYLHQKAAVLKLGEAAQKLGAGTLPDRAVVITFDDGYANNLYTALPLLKRYALPATIFVSTGLVESQDFFPFHKLAYLQSRGVPTHASYKSDSLSTFESDIASMWAESEPTIPADQFAALRAMTVDELKQIPLDLVEIGSHTHRHVILRNENREVRDNEIATSIARIKEWTGSTAETFSYPNGLAGDFDSGDKQALRSAGIRAAVSAITGSNSRETDVLELRRYPVTMHHDPDTFIAELTGFRSFMKRITN